MSTIAAMMYTDSEERNSDVSAIIRHKHLRLDQRKLDRARRILGARTDTETLERALDLILAEERTRQVLRSVGGKGRVRPVFP